MARPIGSRCPENMLRQMSLALKVKTPEARKVLDALKANDISQATVTRIRNMNHGISAGMGERVATVLDATFPNWRELKEPVVADNACTSRLGYADFLRGLKRDLPTAFNSIDNFIGLYLCYRLGIWLKDSIIVSAMEIYKDGDAVMFREIKRLLYQDMNGQDVHDSDHEYVGVITRTSNRLTFFGRDRLDCKLMMTDDISGIGRDRFYAIALTHSPKINTPGACRILIERQKQAENISSLLPHCRIYKMSAPLPENVTAALPAIMVNGGNKKQQCDGVLRLLNAPTGVTL